MAGKFESVEQCLEKNVPEDELKELKRILYGNPCRYSKVTKNTFKGHGVSMILAHAKKDFHFGLL